MDASLKIVSKKRRIKIDSLSTLLEQEVPFDETSRKGKFAWITVGCVNLPYILRNENKFIAVRLVGRKLIDKFTNSLNSTVYTNFRIKSHFITENEVKLLTEIVQKHWDGTGGKKSFTTKDLIVPLKEAVEFYEFIYFCHLKTINIHYPITNSCGFIQIDETIIPYIKKNGKKFVPTFFYDDISEYIKSRSITIEGWDFAYLRFHCLIIGIHHAILDGKSCSMIDSTDRIVFSDSPEIKEYWPPKVFDIHHLAKGDNSVNLPWFKMP